MRIVCISDTHGMHRQIQVPEGDLLIHAGDSLARGTLDDLEDLDEWLGSLPHRHKIVIAGNHDWCFQDDPDDARKLLTNAHYLQDNGLELEGLRFWGSPWTPVFFNWAFNLERGDAIAERWSLIPEKLDVLITHGPPAGILDPVAKGTCPSAARIWPSPLKIANPDSTFSATFMKATGRKGWAIRYSSMPAPALAVSSH